MTTIKTPLPEKFKGEWDKDSFGGKVNEIIDYLAELTEVVEGKQAPTLKETLLKEVGGAACPVYGIPIIAVSDLKVIINRLIP